jgi:hypothetical protein
MNWKRFVLLVSTGAATAILSSWTAVAASQTLSAAILPAARSVQVGETATAFATIINSGTTTALECRIANATAVAATFAFQTTDPATNQPSGSPNALVNIPAGQRQTFLIALTPTTAFDPIDVQLDR